MPANELAERCVLSVMMADETCATRALSDLDTSDFFYGKNRSLFIVMKRLMDEGRQINMAEVAGSCEDYDYALEVGTEGLSFVSELDSYINQLQETRQRRELITTCGEIVRAAEENEYGFLAMAQRRISEIAITNGDMIEPVGVAALEAVTSISTIKTGESTGYSMLDIQLDGMHPGNLIVVGGRPSMGKTAFAMNIAVNVALRDKVVAVFSMEMEKEQILQRAAFALSGCSRAEAATDEIKADLFVQAGIDLSKLQMYIDDKGGLTEGNIRSRCYRIKQITGRLDLVVVDYLQLMRCPVRKSGTREQEVAELSRSMKLMAKEMGCPIILLSQLNRGLEARTDKEPRMADLRESGAIEQDADVIIFLYRPAVYEETGDQREAYAIVAKNRNGETGAVRLDWDGAYFRFTTH